MTKTLLYNGRVIAGLHIIDNGYIYFEGAKITAIGTGVPDVGEDTLRVDVEGRFISPGFIDIHIHGGGGFDFMDADVESFTGVAATHVKHGTTAMCPTTLTAEEAHLYQVLDTYSRARAANTTGAQFLGLHLEGPYFAFNQRGAQDPKFIRNPDAKEYRAILDYSEHIIRWSVAPELPGALEFGDYLVSRGVLPSFAHTEALYDDIVNAYAHGYTLATHFYSAMLGVTRKNAFRYAGAVEACYLLDDMDVEVIADSIHVPQPLLELIYKIKNPDRIILITDAMRAAGTADRHSILGDRQHGLPVLIEDGVAKLPDRTAFAGSVATADRLIRNFWKLTKAPLAEVVQMMTANPARVIGWGEQKGSLAVNKDADIVVFDDEVAIAMTIVCGEIRFNNLTN